MKTIEKITLKLDPIKAQILETILGYELGRLERAEELDPCKCNGYLKEACKEYLEAYQEATKQAK